MEPGGRQTHCPALWPMQEFTVEVEESLGTSLCETKRGDGKNSAWPTSPTVPCQVRCGSWRGRRVPSDAP